jgi:hypothetical protein
VGDYTRLVKKIMHENGCYFIRKGKGDHEIWHSPIVNQNVAVDGRIKKRVSANETLKDAGISKKI